MSRQILPFVDEATRNAERAQDLTSTDVAALFGVSPYCTPFELWHRKKGGLQVEAVENERTKWGLLLQDSIARGFADERGFEIRRMNEYVRIPAERVASSFDYRVLTGCRPYIVKIIENDIPTGVSMESTIATEGDDDALIEVKNVDSLAFRRGWIETDFGLEAPAHIELQAQHQCLVADVRRIYIVALVGGNTLHVLERERDDVIAQRILDAAAEFWARTEPPEPDFRQDAETIARLYGYSSAGKVIEADARMLDLMAAYKGFGMTKKSAEKSQQACKAELLTLIGDAERVEGDGYTLSAKTVPEGIVETYTRAAYRGFRITERGVTK